MKKLVYILAIISQLLLTIGCTEDELLTYSEVGTMTGKVVEAESFEPIKNSKVTISPTNNTTFTDEEGNFNFQDIPIGEYSVQAEKEGFLAGYEPATIVVDSNINIIFELDVSDALNKPPSPPEILSPEDNSTDHELEVELIWSQSNDVDEGDELIYGVQLRNDYDQTLIKIEELTDTTYVVNNLKHGVKYFWQVSVNDGHNNEVLTPISTFETTSFPENRHLFVRNISDHNVIYSINDEGEEIQLTNNSINCWRPRKSQSANLIAFLKTQNTETHIFTMNPDGTDIQQVTSANPMVGFKQDELDFSWSSNGDRIIYPSFNKLFLINKDGSGNQLIYQTIDGSLITECDWSYDESTIALKTNNINGYNVKIFTINMNGTIQNTVVTGVSGAAGGINLSLDNTSILYTLDISGYEDNSYRQLNTHIFNYIFDTLETIDISANKEDGFNDLDPRFSPNEAKIIFVNTSNDGLSEKQVFEVDLEGDTRTLLISNAYMPDWE